MKCNNLLGGYLPGGNTWWGGPANGLGFLPGQGGSFLPGGMVGGGFLPGGMVGGGFLPGRGYYPGGGMVGGGFLPGQGGGYLPGLAGGVFGGNPWSGVWQGGALPGGYYGGGYGTQPLVGQQLGAGTGVTGTKGGL